MNWCSIRNNSYLMFYLIFFYFGCSDFTGHPKPQCTWCFVFFGSRIKVVGLQEISCRHQKNQIGWKPFQLHEHWHSTNHRANLSLNFNWGFQSPRANQGCYNLVLIILLAPTCSIFSYVYISTARRSHVQISVYISDFTTLRWFKLQNHRSWKTSRRRRWAPGNDWEPSNEFFSNFRQRSISSREDDLEIAVFAGYKTFNLNIVRGGLS